MAGRTTTLWCHYWVCLPGRQAGAVVVVEEQEGDHFVCLLQMMDGGTDVAAAAPAAHKESPRGSKTMWQNECDYVSNYRMICQKGRLIDKIMAAELYGAH